MNIPDNGWKPGDLAICLALPSGQWKNSLTGGTEPGPSLDQVLRVTSVYADTNFLDHRSIGLEFEEFPDGIYPAGKFRRIVPDIESATDRDIIALVRGRGLRVSA